MSNSHTVYDKMVAQLVAYPEEAEIMTSQVEEEGWGGDWGICLTRTKHTVYALKYDCLGGIACHYTFNKNIIMTHCLKTLLSIIHLLYRVTHGVRTLKVYSLFPQIK